MHLKKRYLWLLLLFFIVPTVQSNWIDSLDNGILGYWDFNENANFNATDKILGFNLSLTNSSGWESGVRGSAYRPNNTAENVTTGIDFNRTSSNHDNATINLWVKRSDPNWQGKIISTFTGINADLCAVSISTTLETSFFAQTWDGGPHNSNTINASLNNWTMISLTQTNTTMQLFVNGTQAGSNVTGFQASDGCLLSNYNVTLFSYSDKGTNKFGGGSVDELGLWDRVLSPSEISSLYSEGRGAVYQDFEPNVTLISPFNNTNVTLLPQTFNCSAIDNNQIKNISLWIDNTQQATFLDGINNVSSFETTASASQGFHNWTCSSYDELEQIGWADSNWSFFVNTSILTTLESPSTGTLTTNVNQDFICSATTFGVTNLTNVTFTLWNSIPSIEATTFRALTLNDTQNETFTVTSLNDNNYEWNCLYTDTNNIRINGGVNSTITIDTTLPAVALLLPIGTFPSVSGIPLNFTIVETNENICRFSLNGGTTNTTVASCANTTFTGSAGANILDFFAIDLANNEIANQTNFTVLNVSDLSNRFVLEKNVEQISLFIINGSSTLTNAQLTYNNTVSNSDSIINNGTGIFINKTITTEQVDVNSKILNITFQWNLTFLLNGIQTNITTDFRNQSIFQIFIGNETNSVTDVQTLNFTVRNEDDDTIVNSSIEAEFTIRPEGGSTFSRQYTFNVPNNNTINDSRVAYTIFPQWGNLSADYFLQYSANGFVTREFHEDGIFLDNSTRDINLSIAASGTTTAITINVEDEGGAILEGVVVEAQKKNIGLGTFEIVEIENTNPDGKAFFNLVAGENFYRFVFKIAGDTKLTTAEFKLDEIEYFFVLVLRGTTGISTENELNSIISTLQFNVTACHNITFEWNDVSSIGSQFKLNVFNVSLLNGTVLSSSQTSTASSGTLSFSLVPNSCDVANGTFLAQTFVTLSSDGLEHQLGSLLVELIDRIAKSIQRDGLLFSLIVVGTFAGFGAATGNPSIFIATTILGLWIMTLTGFLALSVTSIITLVVIGLIFMRYLKT